MRFRVLGALEIRDGGGGLLALNRRKQRVVLAMMLLRANRPIRTAELVEQLWGEHAPPSATANLQSYVAGLRRLLDDGGEPRLPTHRGGYLLRVAEDELDSERFERLALSGRTALEAGEPELALERLTEALGLWRGGVLEDLPLPDALHSEVARLDGLRLDAVEDRFAACLALGRHEVAAAELPTLTGGHPLRERLWELEMLALYRCGRQADALATYRRAREILNEEVGVEPGTALRDLHHRILTADPSLNPATTARTSVPRQLPAAVPDFIGRDEALAELDACSGEHGVITAITGGVGIGKSALAVHWAHRSAELFPDGQLYADLRGHTTDRPAQPMDVLTGFLTSLGVPAAEVPIEQDSAASLYRSLVANRRILVVLDDAVSAEQVRPLLPGAPPNSVLVTSRNRLNGLVAGQGAKRVILGPLAQAESIALLGRVAGEPLVMAEYAAAQDLARLCGGVPLALRIAGANLCGQSLREYTQDLSTEDFLAALSIPGDEAASVLPALTVSYTRLSVAAQRLLQLLGLLPYPRFTLPDAAGLLRTSVANVRGPLMELVTLHLVDASPQGFSVQDLVRRFGAYLAEAPDLAPTPF